MKVTKFAAAAALCLGMAAGTVSAQGTNPAWNAPMHGQGPFWAPGIMFDQFLNRPGIAPRQIIDQNGDGVVAPDEAAASRETAFLQMDGNGDGVLGKGEFMSGTAPRWGRPEDARRFTQRETRFGVLDANKDAKVTLAEFLDAAEKEYRKADRNGDGSVSVWEYRGRGG